ncbi:MAG TPA: ParB/RepB/Spo0J family partition protein [Solirubrobacterales bacterium]|nr:ParB/RepB/Spo0J family partition protein [Solirubrobacterales bacterium]
MSKTATATPTEIQQIPTGKIFEVPGFNPRGDFARDDEEFLSLKASIAERGIESPIKVGTSVDGGHPIIFGHRRFAAAAELGLETVPAIVDTSLDEKQRYLAALAENRARAEMSPIAEAKALLVLRDDFGMKQAEAADALSMSERSARNRQRLLEVPESVQALVEAGELPLEAVIHLGPIAAVRPKAVELIVQKAGDLQKLTDKGAVGTALEQVANEAGLQAIAEYEGRAVHPNSVAVDKDFRKKLKELWDGIPNPPYNKPLFHFGDEDAKKAKQAGSLFEFTFERWGEKRTVRFITDPVLTFELAKLKIPAMDKAARDLIARQGSASSAGQPPTGESAKEQERLAKEREKEEKARAKANEELTDSLGTLANPKATDLDIVRLAVVMALGEDEVEIDEVVADGLGELLPETYGWPEDEDCPVTPGLTVVQELAAAKNAGEALQVFLRVVLAQQFLDGGKGWWRLRGADGDFFDRQDMLDSIAERLGVVPAAAKKKVKERRKDAEKKAKENAQKRAEAEAKWKAEQEEAAAAAESEGGSRADNALELIKANPKITAATIAMEMGIKPNYLYRILGDLEKAGKVKKAGREYTAVEKG